MAKILIVEDEKNMQDIIAEYMKKGGHTCFTADDGVDALMVLKNNPMDLMILDIMMPHLDGFSVCKMAREAGPVRGGRRRAAAVSPYPAFGLTSFETSKWMPGDQGGFMI